MVGRYRLLARRGLANKGKRACYLLPLALLLQHGFIALDLEKRAEGATNNSRKKIKESAISASQKLARGRIKREIEPLLLFI